MPGGTASTAETFERRFRRARSHLRWRSAVHSVAKMAPWLELAWLGVFLLGRAGWPVMPGWLAAAGLATVLVTGLGWRLWRAPSGRDAALVLDRRLGTRELVTAATESTSGKHPLARLARRRAAIALERSSVATALPFAGWRSWRPAILGGAAVVLAFFLPLRSPGMLAAAEAIDPVLENAAETLAEELEPLIEEIVDSERPEAEEALGRLQELIEEMQTGELETVDDALVAVNRLEQTFRELSDEAAGEQAGFDQLVEDLGSAPLSADLATAMTDGDRQALREALDRMGEALTGAEARDAAMERQMALLEERLSELARLLEQSGESELAAAIRELLEALQQGDLEKAREMLASEEVAGACQAAGEQASDERLGMQLAELLGLGRYLLGQTPAELGSRDGDGGGDGTGRGSGPHPGTETTHLETRGYATGDPILRDRQTSEAGDWQLEFESRYGSQLERASGEDLRVSGRTGEAGELKSQVGRGLGVRGEGSLPLGAFATPGALDPERAADLESVPLGYRDLVRRYFKRQPTPGDSP